MEDMNKSSGSIAKGGRRKKRNGTNQVCWNRKERPKSGRGRGKGEGEALHHDLMIICSLEAPFDEARRPISPGLDSLFSEKGIGGAVCAYEGGC